MQFHLGTNPVQQGFAPPQQLTGGHDATTICAATAAPTRTTSSLPSAHAGAITASAGIAYTVIIWLTTGTRRTHDARKHSTHYASHTTSTAATADGSDNLRPQHTNTDTQLHAYLATATTRTTGSNTYPQFAVKAASIHATFSISTASTDTTPTYSTTFWPFAVQPSGTGPP